MIPETAAVADGHLIEIVFLRRDTENFRFAFDVVLFIGQV